MTWGGGIEDKLGGSYKDKYVLNKNGLLVSINEANQKTVFKRNKKGYVKGYDQYNSKGEKTRYGIFKLKSGKYASSKIHYEVGNSTPIRNTTYTYYKNNVAKKVRMVAGDYSLTWNYDKKGNLTKHEEKSGDYILITKYKNTFNKTGKLTKQRGTISGSANGTTTIKNTYNKKGLLTKKVTNTVLKDSSGKIKSRGSETVTYTYKKVKVPKKYWKAVELDKTL